VSEAKDLLAKLAAKLKTRAEWSTDGYYTDEIDSAKNRAVRETLEGIASDIEELLLPEPEET
jgi:hypothetical protein